MALCSVICDAARSNDATSRRLHTFDDVRQNDTYENPYLHKTDHSYQTLAFLIFGCLSAIILYSCSPFKLTAYTHAFWLLSLGLLALCACVHLRRCPKINNRPWFKFRHQFYYDQLPACRFFTVRNLVRFMQPFSPALSFFYRLSPVVFANHLRSFSSPRNCAVPFVSTFLLCPALSSKLYQFSSSKLHRSMSWRTYFFETGLESGFSDFNDAEKDMLLSQFLIEFDLNSLFEKNAKFVLSIYHAILDLKLTSALKILDPGFLELRSELVAVFRVVGMEYNLDDSESSALASKLWLETYTEDFPCLTEHWVMSHCHNMEFLYDKVLCPRDYRLHSFEGIRRRGPYSLDVNLRILESAWKGISSGRYYEETFNIISDLIFYSEERNVLVEDMRFQELIDLIFQETVKFLSHNVECRSSQVQLCAKELEDFVGSIPYRKDNIVYLSSFYNRIVSLGDSALLVARSIIESEG